MHNYNIGIILEYFDGNFKEKASKQLAKNPNLKHPTEEIAIQISNQIQTQRTL